MKKKAVDTMKKTHNDQKTKKEDFSKQITVEKALISTKSFINLN